MWRTRAARYRDHIEPERRVGLVRDGQNVEHRHRRDSRRDDLAHPTDLPVGQQNARSRCGSGLSVFRNADHDNAASSVGQGCHIDAKRTLVAVARPVRGPLIVQVKRLSHGVGDELLDVCSLEIVQRYTEESFKAAGP